MQEAYSNAYLSSLKSRPQLRPRYKFINKPFVINDFTNLEGTLEMTECAALMTRFDGMLDCIGAFQGVQIDRTTIYILFHMHERRVYAGK